MSTRFGRTIILLGLCIVAVSVCSPCVVIALGMLFQR